MSYYYTQYHLDHQDLRKKNTEWWYPFKYRQTFSFLKHFPGDFFWLN